MQNSNKTDPLGVDLDVYNDRIRINLRNASTVVYVLDRLMQRGGKSIPNRGVTCLEGQM